MPRNIWVCLSITVCILGWVRAGSAEEPMTAAFLIEDGVYNSELVAPLDILHHTPFHVDPGMKVFTVAKTLDSITSFEGLRITPDYDYKSAPKIDVLIVPSAERHVSADFDDHELVGFVRERAAESRFVISLCDGAFVLAKAGLLNDRTCTTFPGDIPQLKERYPKAHVLEGVSFVVDGKFITSVGGAKSYDPALYLVERLYGEKPAVGVARGLVIDWNLEEIPHYIADSRPNRAYDVGSLVAQDVSVQKADGERERLLDLFEEGDRVMALFIFGGGEYKGDAQRAGLWCEDSMNELPLLRHAMARFDDAGVTFVPVVCPPFFHEERFGYTEGGFGSEHAEHADQRAKLVESTTRAVDHGVIPFQKMWFDFEFKLLLDVEGLKVDQSKEADWVGRFRSRRETQQYGTPSLWLLSRKGQVLVPPLHGNNYEKNVRLKYTSRELEAVIAKALQITAR